MVITNARFFVLSIAGLALVACAEPENSPYGGGGADSSDAYGDDDGSYPSHGGAGGGGGGTGSTDETSAGSCGGSCSLDADCPGYAVCISTDAGGYCLPASCQSCLDSGLTCMFDSDDPTCNTGSCTDGSNPSSPGGGSPNTDTSTCHNMSNCIGGSLTPLTTTGVCPSGTPFTGTFTNTCDVAVRCKLCQPGEANCETWTFGPGETQGGWATFMWCESGGYQVYAYCTAADDPYACGP